MNNKLNQLISRINSALSESVGYSEPLVDTVIKAEEYSLMAGGKRLRPILALLFCEACGKESGAFINVASAIEMIHTFSLIHDDLPCMDNDDYRRGKPSCHKMYGEAQALLAGDSLVFLAFETVCKEAGKGVISDKAATEIIELLARSSGAFGMTGGQIIDIESENKDIPIGTLRELQQKKTGALISAACEMGCILADAHHMIPFAKEYAENLGLAFQITDDILDVRGSFDTLGKPIGSDQKNNKTTFVSVYGIDKAELVASELTDKAVKCLDSFKNTDCLKDLTYKLLKREK